MPNRRNWKTGTEKQLAGDVSFLGRQLQEASGELTKAAKERADALKQSADLQRELNETKAALAKAEEERDKAEERLRRTQALLSQAHGTASGIQNAMQTAGQTDRSMNERFTHLFLTLSQRP